MPSAALETVDIPAVEIMATGGPVFAIGSKRGGDFYTRADLEAIANAHVELGNEIRAPLKVGHSDRQQLLANSGITVGELPAVGWLDSRSFQVVDNDDGTGSKLVADIKAVPKKLAQLMESGAYRTRSSEIKRYASQTTQKTYDWVVYGLALLGNNTPAIQTLDDVYKLYEAAGIDDPGATVVVVQHAAAGATVWEPSGSLEDLRSSVNDALNPLGYDIPGVQQLWVRDIASTGDAALVSEGWGDDADAYVVAFTVAADGTVTVAARDTWQPAEQTWVAPARKNERHAESRSMSEATITTEELAPLAEKLGVDGDVTIESLTEAAETRANELAELKTKADEAEQRKLEADDATGKLSALEKRFEASERRLFEAGRDSDIEKAMREKRLDPEGVEKWEKRYEDLGADTARELLFELPVNEDFKTFGSDESGGEDGGGDANAKAYEAEISRNTGTPVEELI